MDAHRSDALPMRRFLRGVYSSDAHRSDALPMGVCLTGVPRSDALLPNDFPPDGFLTKKCLQGVLPRGVYPSDVLRSDGLPLNGLPLGVYLPDALPMWKFPLGGRLPGAHRSGGFPQDEPLPKRFPKGVDALLPCSQVCAPPAGLPPSCGYFHCLFPTGRTSDLLLFRPKDPSL